MTDYANVDAGNSRTWPTCDDCGLRHSSPRTCYYPRLRALFPEEITEDEDRFIRWMAGWSYWEVQQFEALVLREREVPKP